MRKETWGGGMMLVLAAVSSGLAQEPATPLIPSGVLPQNNPLQKVIEVPVTTGPKIPQQTLDVFSFRQLLAKVFPFVSLPSTMPSLPAAVPALPGSNASSPLQPLPPRFTLPAPSLTNPFQPALPRTTLPKIPENPTFKPVLPIR
jgi:hypothetical protein